ncbi:MAG TPA: aminodeoxychorismate lyase, partial [Burkholderiales bacterium]|nr:aminodeoxychorismate lyase [Burkholderiales bacterium]
MAAMKKLAIIVLALVLITVTFYLLAPLSLPRTPLSFTLEEGSLSHAAMQMEKAGVLKRPQPFVWLARVMGKASSIKAGNYELDRPLTPLGLLSKITG